MHRTKVFPAVAIGNLIILGGIIAPAPAQAPQAQGKGPREIAEEYKQMKADGSLLTSEGWNRANQLFLRPSPPPADQIIAVTSQRGDLDERLKTDKRVELDEWGIYNLGTIDSMLRFKSSGKSDWGVYVYTVVLTDKHWEPGPNGAPWKEVNGPWMWKLDGAQSVRWATVDAAIRYVKQMRDKATDPSLKRNADNTIAILKRLEGTPRR